MLRSSQVSGIAGIAATPPVPACCLADSLRCPAAVGLCAFASLSAAQSDLGGIAQRHRAWRRLLQLAADLRCPSAVSAGSAFFQWCHSAQNVAGDPYWSVVTSGALVTSSYSATTGFSQTLQVLSITGTRTQRNATTTVVSTITELAPQGASGCGNQNQVQTHWPQLSTFPGGLAYYIDPPVQLPLSSGPPVSIIGLYNQPPAEWGVSPTRTAVSYFIFEAGNTGVALNCPLPAAVSYSFHYITVPVNVYHPVFSACMTGSMQLIGPFAMGNDLTNEISPTYIMQNASGYRLFTNDTGGNGGAAYRQTIINVGTDDGGDFVFYTAYPWFDDAGLTFELSSASVVQDGMQFGGANWVNLWREDSYPSEAANTNPGNPDNYLDWHYALQGDEPEFQCPQTVSFPIFNFCHYAESGEPDAQGGWTVVESGVLWTATMNAQGQYYAVAIGGRRLHWTGAELQVNTSIAQMLQLNASYPSAESESDPTDSSQQPLGQDAASYEQLPFYNDNLLGTRFPYLSPRGLLYQTLDFVPLPGTDIMTQFIGWAHTPPVEAVNISTQALGTGFSFFAYQDAALGPMSCDKRSAPRQSFDFYFSTTPTAGANATEAALYGDWSVCVSGSLTAIGPYYLPSASSASNSTTAFFAVQASGLRVFIDQLGAATVNSITGVSNSGGADFALYMDGPSGALDAGGLSFSFDSLPRFATGLSASAWTRLYSDEGVVSEAAAGYVAVNSGPFAFAPSAQSALPVCMQPGQSLSFSQAASGDSSSGSSGPGAGYLVLATLLSLIGCLTALLSVEHTIHNLRNRSDARWLFWLAATAVTMGVCGVWACMLAQYASLAVPCDACVDGIQLSYSTAVVLLGLLPAVLPLAAGLTLLTVTWSPSGIGRVGVTQVGQGSLLNTTQNTGSMLSKSAQEDTVLGGGEAGAADRQLRRGRARGRLGRWLYRVKADLTLLLLLVAANFSLKTVLAAALVALSLVLCRVTLLFSLSGNVTFSPSIAASVLSSLLVWLLVTPALSVYFFGVRYRWLAVLLVTAATVADYQIHLHSMTIEYAPSHREELSGRQLFASLMSASDLVLVGGVIGAVSLAALAGPAVQQAALQGQAAGAGRGLHQEQADVSAARGHGPGAQAAAHHGHGRRADAHAGRDPHAQAGGGAVHAGHGAAGLGLRAARQHAQLPARPVRGRDGGQHAQGEHGGGRGQQRQQQLGGQLRPRERAGQRRAARGEEEGAARAQPEGAGGVHAGAVRGRVQRRQDGEEQHGR